MSELTRQQFFAAIAPTIVLVRKQGSPIFPSLRLAQSLLESGGVIHPWNNLGGIKVGSGKLTPYWRGATVTKSTWEYSEGEERREQANFRAYRTLYHYYKDQDELFKQARYAKVLTAKTVEEQVNELKRSGYATDPNYAVKLMSIIKSNNLEIYDTVSSLMKTEPEFASALLVPVMVNNELFCTSYLENGTNYIPVRLIAEKFGAKVDWKKGQVFVNDQLIDSRLVGSTSYVKPRDLIEILPLKIEWDSYAKVLFFN